jgi:endonuclease/exonuclease/phosphatase family metal-dependent hydrolase
MKIKYISLNIWAGELLESALKFLKKENPDILSLQEVYHNPEVSNNEILNLYLEVVKVLGFEYHVFAPAYDHISTKDLRGVQGNAVFSKFPIVNSEINFFDSQYAIYNENEADPTLAPRNVLNAEIKINEQSINVFNVHGIWGKDGKDNIRREKMVDRILELTTKKSNVILSGDFNLNEKIYPLLPSGQPDLGKGQNTQAVLRLEEKLVNVFKNERITSFNIARKDFDKTGYGVAVVDMVFVSKNFKVLNHSCPEVDVSDHLPTICEIEIS